MDKKFFLWLFQKISNFPDFLWSANKFPDFPWLRMETLPLLAEIPKVKSQDHYQCKFREIFMNTAGNYTFF